MAQRILALELVSDGVRAAVAERAWNSIALVGTFEAFREPGEPDQAGALGRLLEQTGKPDIVISALPGEAAANRLLTLPFTDRRKLEQAVPFALEEHLPFSVDDAVVAFTPVARRDGSSVVVAAMVRKDDLRQHLELLAKLGLDPKTVTLSALALPSLVTRTFTATNASHVILDIDQGRSSLVVLDSTGVPCAFRTLKVGLNDLDSNGQVQPASAALVSSIRQTLIAKADQTAEPDLILTGPAASIPEVSTELQQALSVEVRRADEFDYSGIFEDGGAGPVRFTSCLAMLLGELPKAPSALLNFRQGEFAFRGRSGDLAPLYTSGLLAAAVVMIAVFHFGLGLFSGYHRLSVLNRQIRVAAAPALGRNPPADAKAALVSGIKEMNRRLRLTGGGGGHNTPLDMMLEISRAIPGRLSIDLDDLLIDEGGIKLSGHADSFATIDQVKRALATSGAFGDIQVTDAKVGADLHKVEFRMSVAPKDTASGVN